MKCDLRFRYNRTNRCYAISTVDDEVAISVPGGRANAIDSAISTVDDEVSDLSAVVTTGPTQSIAPSHR